MGTDTGLLAHWPLAGDCRDRSGNGHHGRNQGADLAAGGAVFDGRGAHVLVPPSAALDLGTGDFTLAVQIHTDAVLDDVPGDIVSRYAPGTRTGFQLSLLNNAGVTAAQANYRHLHFGIDAGSNCAWADCGRPGNNLRVYSLCVFRGDLYAGTFETGADEAGGVYRYDGRAGWKPCGSPDAANTVASLCVFDGDLYAGTLPLGQVYRYDGRDTWTLTGQLDTTPDVKYRRVWSMAVYRGRLFVGTLPSGRVCALQAGANVTHDHELEPGWRRLAAVRRGGRLELSTSTAAASRPRRPSTPRPSTSPRTSPCGSAPAPSTHSTAGSATCGCTAVPSRKKKKK